MAAVGPSKSRALYYEMQLREALLASDNVHALFDKERRVQRCIRLADELCGDLTVFGPILHTILVELKAAIFRCSVVVMSNCHVETGGADSDESLARGFFGCGVFSDTATVADIQARTSYREIPCFVLLDVAYRERTSVLQAKAEFQSLQEHALAKHTNVLVNERLLRKEVNITMGELADTQAQVARSKLAFESLQMEAKQQRRDMASSTLYLQREMQAMSVAITQYQAQIRELQRERATSDSVRKDFESVRLMASASPPSTHDAATKELLQTLQTDMQLLLLRNARLREYDSDIIRCSPDMRHKFRQDFVHDIGSLLNEHAVLEAYVKEQEAAIGDVASTIQVPHRTLLVHNPPVPDTVLWAPFVKWHPEPIPKCIPTWTVGDLDVLFTQLWVKIAMVERKWVRWTLEHERDKQTSSLDNNHASDVVPITQVCFDFVEDRYGERRVAVLVMASILQAIDRHVEESPQLDLFGSVFAGEVDQSAWWYLMTVKRHVAQLELDITTDQALRVVGQFLLLPQADVNAVEVCLDE
ncbi:hypothetical protein, variant 3 [Aphanomyces astaci]|uniref:Uncharacterized protein n=1 Tax=Aphanomyces astaci TaxID=112090 RepID=W4FMW7_APHAT|nr:hypothetical protein, variant 2 [Aphanomyces astaci]XP_009842591.1 hypothetical protein, variant 3 [Aphanomyces astaci]ETV68022.1 hypothetical protein, variant 2 [Aphanomyces astaci]ETV68023.1 hypothetical protein, variant 3 [Aphanomyces astaci]|eukprot:XP_009842587.1 hypothetical protein, variant 2 [Aphanomyces astaci]